MWTRFNAIKVLLHQACLFSQLCLNLFLFCLVSWCELKTVRIGAPHGGLNKLNNGINWPFHHDLWGHFHHRKRYSSHTVQCVVLVLFLVGSSIKDVGKLEGEGSKFLEICRWKEVKKCKHEGGVCQNPGKIADVCYGWSLLTFFFLKAKNIREFINWFVYAFIHEL